MSRKILSIGLAFICFVCFSSFTFENNNYGDWVKLGSKKVNFKVNRDVINVGVKDGRFAKLKVLVKDGNLNMHKMVVHYGNKSKEEIELRHNFRKGTDSRVIDLKGKKRIITKIVFWYDSKTKSPGRATVVVWGRH